MESNEKFIQLYVGFAAIEPDASIGYSSITGHRLVYPKASANQARYIFMNQTNLVAVHEVLISWPIVLRYLGIAVLHVPYCPCRCSGPESHASGWLL